MRNSWLTGSLFVFAAAVMPHSYSYASETMMSVAFDEREDIDYSTNQRNASFRHTSSIGLFDCHAGNESGVTRIDSFNNIFGIGNVRAANYRKYNATRHGCKYGGRKQFGGGRLDFGFGFKRNDGDSGPIRGGKYIDEGGHALKLKYVSNETSLGFVYSKKSGDYLLLNESTLSDYDTSISLDEKSLSINYFGERVYMTLGRVDGGKSESYTLALFPVNRFKYAYSSISVGPVFRRGKDTVFYMAPTFQAGSVRGSFNALTIRNRFSGIVMGYKSENHAVRFSVERVNGDGRIAYLPVTDDLAETLKQRKYSLSLDSGKWGLSLAFRKSSHVGSLQTTVPVYMAIFGSGGPFANLREEISRSITVGYRLRRVKLIFDATYVSRKDRQYNFSVHTYREKQYSLGVQYNY